MKRSSLIIIFVVVIALLFTAWKVYDGLYLKKQKNLIIKCHYKAYACGDCYPQWQVDSGFAVEKGLTELIGKDIYVDHDGVAIEELISDGIKKCTICYDFYFAGSLKKTLSGKYRFNTNSFRRELRFPNCCNQKSPLGVKGYEETNL